MSNIVENIEQPVYTAKDYKTELKSVWCPRCGDFGVLTGFYKAFELMQIHPYKIAIISGIGCSSRLPGYVSTYGFNTIHGRALPIAQGVKLANPELTVIATGGDGDGFSIGAGHIPHAVRRNINFTYLVMDNQVYGLTKGQMSPTTSVGTITSSTAYGSIDQPINPLTTMLTYGAKFVAQASSTNLKQLTQIIKQAIEYPGFAFINCQSPCVTFDPIQDESIKKLKDISVDTESLGHDHTDRSAAYKLAEQYGQGKVYNGIYYMERPTDTYETGLDKLREKALAKGKLNPKEVFNSFLVK